MKYYVYLKQKGEGCDYSIGCGQILIPLQSTEIDEAKKEVEVMIEESYTGETELSEAIIFSGPIQIDTKSIYSNIKSRQSLNKQKRQHIKDVEEFERLKQKLGK